MSSFLPIIKDSVYSFFSSWSFVPFYKPSFSFSSLVAQYEAALRSAFLLDSLARVFSLVKVCAEATRDVEHLVCVESRQPEGIHSRPNEALDKASSFCTPRGALVSSSNHSVDSHANLHVLASASGNL